MPIVTDPCETRDLLRLLADRRAALPCFCTENPWTTEAVLLATSAAGRRLGVPAPPVSVSYCASYHGRQNLSKYWFCADPSLGRLGVLADLAALLDPASPYAACRVLPGLDHGQPDGDAWLLEGHPDEFAIVMFDGGELPFEENIDRTADYVARFGDRVVVEGAVAALKEARDDVAAYDLTTPEAASRFVRGTGCDLVVPNVGTEHRASEAGVARYEAERARAIARAVGRRLVLHGTSCVDQAVLRELPGHGFVKVNIWTAIERTGADLVADYALRNLEGLTGREQAERLAAEGLMPAGAAAAVADESWPGPDLDYFPLANLRDHWVRGVAAALEPYFDLLGYAHLTGV
jgi:fructose/tagatose bisphosphate aldolase